ncbi:PREDICTED: uncharacterized protein LOC104779988 isoform X1 [Camelina sativa]|uniref:Uncharacterized protein LOC104779988 isoform X1 n=1 Tax=Camelina sativa TaxID=90675 RepID=A0ABM0YLA5_CAMSA|nr:PREDICTED: uncharacterized protein LOC104779988 isoform X1 [Camelina sativa]
MKGCKSIGHNPRQRKLLPRNLRTGIAIEVAKGEQRTILGQQATIPVENNLDGVAPDHLTLMEDTHTNKKTKQIQDPSAKEVIENSRKRMEEFRLSQPSANGNGSPTPIPVEMINQFVLEETPQTKGRIFGLGNVAKRLCTSSSPIYDRDPELLRVLQEKDERIEALEKMMEKENEKNKLRDEELASFMAEMRSKFPVNSSS